MRVADEVVRNSPCFGFASQRRIGIDKLDVQLSAKLSQTAGEIGKLKPRDLAIGVGVMNHSMKHTMAVRDIHEPWTHSHLPRRASKALQGVYNRIRVPNR